MESRQYNDVLSTMPRLHTRSRLLELGVLFGIFIRALQLNHYECMVCRAKYLHTILIKISCYVTLAWHYSFRTVYISKFAFTVLESFRHNLYTLHFFVSSLLDLFDVMF